MADQQLLALASIHRLHWVGEQDRESKMSTIDIRARHTMGHTDAQNAADQLAQDLAAKFDIDYGWDEDVIHFERPGVHGQIEVHTNEIRIQAYLGFLLVMLKSPIEQEIIHYLKTHFGCRFPE